jgi:hypothetical protein
MKKALLLICYLYMLSLLLSGCLPIPVVNAADGTSEDKIFNTADDDTSSHMCEASEWFVSHKPSGFAGNRFSLEEAKSFVKNLYDLGAPTITIANIMDEPWRLKEEGGPYADTLIV